MYLLIMGISYTQKISLELVSLSGMQVWNEPDRYMTSQRSRSGALIVSREFAVAIKRI
jgi:hypothetical protein